MMHNNKCALESRSAIWRVQTPLGGRFEIPVAKIVPGITSTRIDMYVGSLAGIHRVFATRICGYGEHSVDGSRGCIYLRICRYRTSISRSWLVGL